MNPILKRILFCFLMVSQTVLHAAVAQTDSNVANIQAGFIYNFTKFIKWETAKPQAEFLITVYNDQGLLSVLEKELSGKKVGDVQIKVSNQSGTELDPSTKIVFIDSSSANDAAKLLANANKLNAVSISRYENMIDSGVCINFYLDDNKVRFEINKKCTENKDYKISSQLLKLARIK